MMVATVTGYEPGELIHSLGDSHICLSHIQHADEQLARQPYPLPRAHLKRVRDSVFDYQFDDFDLIDYRHYPAIHAPVAV